MKPSQRHTLLRSTQKPPFPAQLLAERGEEFVSISLRVPPVVQEVAALSQPACLALAGLEGMSGSQGQGLAWDGRDFEMAQEGNECLQKTLVCDNKVWFILL